MCNAMMAAQPINADHRDGHQPRQHLGEFRLQRRDRNGHDHRHDQQRKPGQSARLVEGRIEIGIASGQRAARELAHPAMQRERDKHRDREDHQRDQRIGQPVEQILDLGQRGSERIHGLSYHSQTGGEYRISWRFAAFPSLDNAAVRWQKARVPIVFKRGGDEKFPAQAVHLVEFADIRDPVLDLDVWRGGRRG